MLDCRWCRRRRDRKRYDLTASLLFANGTLISERILCLHVGCKGAQHEEQLMRKSIVTALCLASTLAVGTSATLAQNYPSRQQDPYAASPSATPRSDTGERRDVPYGQGGTAGTHDTGANVGPGRAGMNHSTGQ
jgi:hypothetical protein